MTAIKYALPVGRFGIAALAILAAFDIGWATLFGVGMGVVSLGSTGIGFWLLSIINKRGEEVKTIEVEKDHLDDEFRKLESTKSNDEN